MTKMIPSILIVSVLAGAGAAVFAHWIGYSWAGILFAYVIVGEMVVIASVHGYLAGDREKNKKREEIDGSAKWPNNVQ